MSNNFSISAKIKNIFLISNLLLYASVFSQCITPPTPTAGLVTTSTATINFPSTIATSTIEWGKAGYSPNTNTEYGNPISSSGYDIQNNINTYTIEGLEPSTTYDVYVRRLCGGGALSANCAKLTFTTTNNCFDVDVPYIETFSTLAATNSFNAGKFGLPECTRSINNITDPKWRGDFANGNGFLSLKGVSNNSSISYFITKGINLTAGVPYLVKFDTNSAFNVTYNVGTSISSIINNNTSSGSGGIFTPSISDIYYFGFLCQTNGSTSLFSLDNIKITDNTNPCQTPSALSATGVSATEISVSYNSPTGTSVFIEYKTQSGNTINTVLAPSSPYVLTGLLPNETYKIRIRQQCATNSLSDFTDYFVVQTANCSTVPSSLVTVAITSNSTLLNWQAPTADYYQIYVSLNNTLAPVNNTGSLYDSTATTKFISGLTSNTIYYYWVRSVCGSLPSAWSTGDQFTTAALNNCNVADDFFPETPFTPACTGAIEGICFARTSELSIINFLANKQYNFSSSIATDYITISNTLGVVYASGQSPLIWSSGSNSGKLIYVIHTNSSCGTDNSNIRIKYITCSSPLSGCASPFGLAATNVSSNNAVLNWNEPSTVPSNGYGYYYSINNITPDATTAPTGSCIANTIAISNLSAQTTYYFWVRSNCNTLNSNWVSGGSFTTPLAPVCGLPSNLSVFNITNTSAQFSWNAPTPAPTTGYQFYATTTNVTPSNAISTTVNIISTSSANFNGLTSGTTYFFWVRSVCGTTASVWVSGGSFTTTGTSFCNAPISPTTSNITTTSATISWTAPSAIPANGYQYYYSAFYSVPTASTIPKGIVAGTSVTLTGLQSGVKYYTWVRSNCGNGQSAWLNVADFTTLSSGCDAPYSVEIFLVYNDGATIKWNTPLVVPSNGYQYYYSTDPSGPTTSAVPSGSSTNSIINLNALMSGTTYYFWVRSNCGTQQSNWSQASSFTTYCSKIINLTDSNPTLSSIQLSWGLQYPTATPANGYDYFISTNNTTPTTLITPTGSTSNTNITITSGLLPNTTYYYWVRSNCGNYLNSWGLFNSFITSNQCTSPSNIVNSSSSIGTVSAYISWTPSVVAPSTGYQYYLSTTNIAPLNSYNTTTNVSTSNTISLTGLTQNTTYYIWVRSICGNETTPWVSGSFSTLAPCSAPSSIVIANITATTANISWTAGAFSPSTGYQYYSSTVNSAPLNSYSINNVSTANSADLTALLPDTTYYIWVRSICGNLKSQWISGNSFTTAQLSSLNCNFALYGLYPALTFTPSCTGTAELIANNAYAGEYTNVNLLANKQYNFSSSISTDFITITDATNTILLANGITPVVWSSNTYSGIVKYFIHSNANCGSTNISRSRFINCSNNLSNNNFNRSEFVLYPNPVTDILNISFDKEISTVSIFNLIGQEVITNFLNKKVGILDVSNLPSGTYIVKVTADNFVKTLKFIKE